MKRILLSLVVILGVSAVVAGATRAYFSDTETSTGNTFAAGTLNLAIDGQEGASVTTKYTISDVKPGFNSMVGQIKLKNTGSVNGKYWMEIKNVVNNENSCGQPEVVADDVTCGTTEGELGGKISGYFQENIAPWSHLNPAISSIDTSDGVRMETVAGSLMAGEERPVVLYAKWLSSATDNLSQGDSVTFDIVFHLDQV